MNNYQFRIQLLLFQGGCLGIRLLRKCRIDRGSMFCEEDIRLLDQGSEEGLRYVRYYCGNKFL